MPIRGFLTMSYLREVAPACRIITGGSRLQLGEGKGNRAEFR